jgi:hypothetical protein
MLDFSQHMIDACTYAEAGFHFEEGGCFSMAAALYENLIADGHAPKVMAMEGATHVMVELSGTLYDHQGIVLSSPKVREIQYAALPAYAAECGRTDDEYQSDKEWATEIITQAKELAVCYERLTGSAMENFGFVNEEADRFFGILRDANAVEAISGSLARSDRALLLQGKLMPDHHVLAAVSDNQAELLDKIYKDPYALICMQDMVERTKASTFWDAAPAQQDGNTPAI